MKMKRFFLVLLAMLLVLSVFTACDDDDDDDSTAGTEEDIEIIFAIFDACDYAIGDGYYTSTESGLTDTLTLKDYTHTSTSIIDNETAISVTIKSGSTVKYVYNSSEDDSGVVTFDIDATVDGTSHSLYLKYTADKNDNKTISKIELDGVEFSEYDAFTAVWDLV